MGIPRYGRIPRMTLRELDRDQEVFTSMTIAVSTFVNVWNGLWTHFNQCPVLPVRINLCNWFTLTQTNSSTRLYPHKANSSRPSSIALPVTHKQRIPQSAWSDGRGILRISSSVMVP
jgi:hypothetical protein